MSCDDVTYNSIYFISSTNNIPTIPDFPLYAAGWLETIEIDTRFTLQIAYPLDNKKKFILYRTRNNANWYTWQAIVSDADLSLPKNPVSRHEKMLNSIAMYGAIDLSLFMNRNVEGSEIKFDWNIDGTCYIHGTSTSNRWTTLFTSSSSLPIAIEPNKLYKIKFNGTNTNLQIYPYINGSIGSALVDTHKDTSVFIPSNVTGLIVRIWAPKNTTINETVDFKMFLDNSFKYSKELDYCLPQFINYYSRTNESANGIVFSWDGYECHVTGETTTNIAFTNIFNNTTSFPPGVTPGGYYTVLFNGDKVSVAVYLYASDGSLSRYLRSYKSEIFYIPSDKVGFLMRIQVAENKTVNETVKIGLARVYPNITYGNSLINYAYSYESGTDCNELVGDGVYFVSSRNSQSSLTNFAYSTGWLFTTSYQDLKFQLAFPYDTSDSSYNPSYRVKDLNGNWSRWIPIASGEAVYQYTTVETGTYNNTYNITTTPTITTDSNGWLQPVDTESSTDTNKTDMTGPILSMLTSTGYCHLAPGIYYVSGSIDMPTGSTLEGCGNKTIIRLLSSVSSGYVIKPSSNCTIKNIRFSGSYSEIDISSSNIGGRNGIYCTGSTNNHNMVHSCFFDGFSGSAIYQYDNGGSVQGYIYMQQCYISNCAAGINIDKYSEYNKYTDVIINKCYYACINNGGNNLFTACTFHGTIGFTIDNSSGTKNNNAHGSVVGCTFNHIDNWNHPDTLGGGDAIKIIDVSNGFIFTGCQIWYGAINIQNARGIQISDTLIGGGTPSITITGSYPVFFSDCIFHQTPSISDTASSKFINCFLDSTGLEI